MTIVSVSSSIFTTNGIQSKTTQSVAFDTASRYPSQIGSDVFFFVSGSAGSKAAGTNGASVFGGDSYVSGVLYASAISGSHQRLLDGSPAFIAGANIVITTQSNGAVAISGSGGSPLPQYIPIGAYSTVDATMGTLAAGGSPGSLNPSEFVVSGYTTSYKFLVLGSATLGNTGSIVLYDMDSLYAAASITVTASAACTHGRTFES